MVPSVQSALYFHTSVESDLHFKAARHRIGMKGRGVWGGGKGRERLSGPWLSFDLISIKQQNLKVKSIKV